MSLLFLLLLNLTFGRVIPDNDLIIGRAVNPTPSITFAYKPTFNPSIRFNRTTGLWEYSTDGSIFQIFAASGGGGVDPVTLKSGLRRIAAENWRRVVQLNTSGSLLNASRASWQFGESVVVWQYATQHFCTTNGLTWTAFTAPDGKTAAWGFSDGTIHYALNTDGTTTALTDQSCQNIGGVPTLGALPTAYNVVQGRSGGNFVALDTNNKVVPYYKTSGTPSFQASLTWPDRHFIGVPHYYAGKWYAICGITSGSGYSICTSSDEGINWVIAHTFVPDLEFPVLFPYKDTLGIRTSSSTLGEVILKSTTDDTIWTASSTIVAPPIGDYINGLGLPNYANSNVASMALAQSYTIDGINGVRTNFRYLLEGDAQITDHVFPCEIEYRQVTASLSLTNGTILTNIGNNFIVMGADSSSSVFWRVCTTSIME